MPRDLARQAAELRAQVGDALFDAIYDIGYEEGSRSGVVDCGMALEIENERLKDKELDRLATFWMTGEYPDEEDESK